MNHSYDDRAERNRRSGYENNHPDMSIQEQSGCYPPPHTKCKFCPPGVPGADGTSINIIGSFVQLCDLIVTHPRGHKGDAALVGQGDLYIWDEKTQKWIKKGNISGPTGATGAGITIKGVHASLAELIAAHPTGEAGDAYVANGIVYVWDTQTQAWAAAGTVGATGATGATGAGIQLRGVYASLAELVAAHPTGSVGEAYSVNGVVYVWDTAANSWVAAGTVGVKGDTGATGAMGATGATGTGITVLGTYETLEQLKEAHPTGNRGDAYVVDGTIYVWDTGTNAWQEAGAVGATGATGATGAGIETLGVYASLADLQREHPTGEPNDAYVVNGIVYVWDERTQSWQAAGPVGVQGATGATIYGKQVRAVRWYDLGLV